MLKSSFHSMAPKCSQTTAALALARRSGLEAIQLDSLRWPPDIWPVVITKLGMVRKMSAWSGNGDNSGKAYSILILGLCRTSTSAIVSKRIGPEDIP